MGDRVASPVLLVERMAGGVMRGMAVRLLLGLVGMLAVAGCAGPAPPPDDTLVVGFATSLTSTFFDPGVTPGTGIPLLLQYAQHDALVRPVRGSASAPSLAERWTRSADGREYDFHLRQGLRFQDGSALTAEDVKFTFERYQGAGARMLKERVARVDVISPLHVRFVLHQPWSDFMTFYGTTASGAGWVVPKRYIERVGDDGFRAHPIGAGPYRLVRFEPGVEFVFEASPYYWRKTPQIRRLVIKVIPDAATRLAAVTRGEIDVAYGLSDALADKARRTPGLRLRTANIPVTNFVIFADQNVPGSPWRDPRVREAANLAMDRRMINEALYLGLGRESSSIIPHGMPFYATFPPYRYDPARARTLLVDAGYRGGFDGGELHVENGDFGEMVQAYLGEVGIKVRLRPSERASLLKRLGEKQLHGLVMTGSGAAGNAATRLEQFARSGGTLSYLQSPELDALMDAQALETDESARGELLATAQKKIRDAHNFLPVLEYAMVVVVGPRLAFDGVNAIPGSPYTTPYEDLAFKQGAALPADRSRTTDQELPR